MQPEPAIVEGSMALGGEYAFQAWSHDRAGPGGEDINGVEEMFE